ncbi:hypothetical protein CSC62_00845 [Pseudoxanthomonas jiangsuensis]|uniref:hypothetical protein n=1 Tax=Pseudoxanthomonas jiangsuensis TaxID=619688 RepID=UPI00139116FB|nr:hypothetical protein [Pseudoxanthomonas jiangsuensis]KAF1699481.1 hypothetical protein CSC62_00845 [Pseudoxanthomonas jiangsuensis]
MKHQIARTAAAVVLGAATSLAAASECEQNFNVNGSFGSGRTYATEARVPDVTYLPALYRVRDKIQEQGLVVLAVQEKNGYIRAANAVTGGEGGTANAPLRVYVTPQDGGGVNVSLQFTIAGGQMTSKKSVMRYMCEIVDAAAAG